MPDNTNNILAVAARAQDINFVTKFEADLHNLLALLGKTEVQVMAPGTAFKIYKTSGTLSAAEVAEKAEIPDSNIAADDGTLVALSYKKYRNLTSIEDIGKKGYDVAVGSTNAALLRLIQKVIRTTIYTAVKTGTGAISGSGWNFQQKIAGAAGALAIKFEDEAYTPVFFANPGDAYDYLGTHDITLETQFGLSYLANFLGVGNVVLDSNVPAGTVIGTAVENLELVAASIADIPGMDMTTDETGILAVRTEPKYENGAIQTVAYCGMAILPVFLDRIVKATASA